MGVDKVQAAYNKRIKAKEAAIRKRAKKSGFVVVGRNKLEANRK